MGQILHASATTMGVVRLAIQCSSDSLRALSKRYGINPKTVAKWKKRTGARGLAYGSAHPALDGSQRRR
jgi:transposase